MARRALQFIPHEPLSLTVTMRAACAGVPCTATETCRDGRCVGAGIVNPDDCIDGCDDGSLGGTKSLSLPGCGDLSGLQAGSPWPTSGGCPTRTDRSPFRVPDQPTKLWSSDHGLQHAPCIAADGTVYAVQTYTPSGLYALDPKTGDALWNVETNTETHSGCAVGDDGAIYFGSTAGTLYAVEPDGALRWEAKLGDGMLGNPVVAGNGLVMAGGDSGIFAARPASGDLVWSFETSSVRANGPTLGVDGTVYFVSSASSLVALDPDDGSVRFESAPLATGEFAWDHAVIAAPDGTVYVGGTDAFALDGSDGTLLWSQPAGAASNLAPPALSPDGRHLLLRTSDLVSFDARSGKEEWRLALGEGGGVVIDGASRAYATSYADTNLSVVDVGSGDVIEQVDLGSNAETESAIGADGTLYATTVDGWLVAVGR